MNVSNRDANLNDYFPFCLCEETTLIKAKGLGKCVKYDAGESVLLSGSPAKHCGLIVSGQAVAFKIDSSGKRYQICLDEGCFIGLETLQENRQYSAKIAAVTELEVFFWNRDGLLQLTDDSIDLSEALQMMDDGRVYQEQWLIPETDLTDPVLCSRPVHWLSIISPAFLIVPLLMICLWACSMMIRRYPVVWVLVAGLLAAAGSLLYRQVTRRANKRLIVTAKNVILVPESNEEDMTIIRMHTLQSLDVERTLLQRLINGGKIRFQAEAQTIETPLVREPVITAALIRDFARRASLGRQIPLRTGKEPQQKIPAAKHEDRNTSRSGTEESGSFVPKFRAVEFHAHWALLIKMILKPLLVVIAALFAASRFKTVPDGGSFRKILFLAAGAGIVGIIYQFIAWQNHRFSIEEDCVKDYSHKPLSKENLNMAMNHKIQSVRYQKDGFFQVLLNYGTVYILAGEGELSFDYVSDPQKVQQQIIDTCAQYETRRMQEEEARRRAYISSLVSEIRQENESGSSLL